MVRVLVRLGDTTLQAAETGGLVVPLRPVDAETIERSLLAAERDATRREQEIVRLQNEISDLVAGLFETLPHPPVEVVDRI